MRNPAKIPASEPLVRAETPFKSCPTCGETMELRSPHVSIEGSEIRVFCSDSCLQAEEIELIPLSPPPKRRLRLLLAIVLLAGALVAWRTQQDPPSTAINASTQELAAHNIDAGTTALVTDAAPADAVPPKKLWTEELARDVWIHPLAGPDRRMPARNSRIFGAVRPGSRPAECRSGHCGVDLGGEVWGEPVLAAHDGIVDHIERNPNNRRGGMYVRLAHRDGTVFTQYFHLAAIPRHISLGAEVRAADVVGLLGQTGVHSSGPHLHFTIAVRPTKDEPMQYIDPEPLIALWPIATPIRGTTASIADAHVLPGRPLGPHRKRRKRRRKARKKPALPQDAPAKPPSAQDVSVEDPDNRPQPSSEN